MEETNFTKEVVAAVGMEMLVKDMDAAGLVCRTYGPAIVKAEDVDSFLERSKKCEKSSSN